MTSLRDAAQQALEVLELYGLTDTHRSYEFERAARAALRAALAQPDIHPQCAQGCEFLAMEQRRNAREAALKERGFE